MRVVDMFIKKVVWGLKYLFLVIFNIPNFLYPYTNSYILIIRYFYKNKEKSPFSTYDVTDIFSIKVVNTNYISDNIFYVYTK